MRNILYLFMVFLLVSCSESEEVSLKEFKITGDVFDSGKRLMSLPYGLHTLEENNTMEKTLIIGVHGSNSRGYEWIYPLSSLDNSDKLVAFFRWDDSTCPGPGIQSLSQNLSDLLVEKPNIKKIILLGHSYGGILVTSFMQNWKGKLPLEIHAIAAPLKGMGPVSSMCGYEPPRATQGNTSLHQWRTIKELDGAFKDLDYDPQETMILNSKITRLPETYKGNKLGHNWSISWVADELLGLNQ
tara:strand:- start:2806 stop:3531 length:726 start_codon:yes stop_codon:yes gene_type:complete